MALTIELPAEVEAAVRAFAERAGVTPEDWIRRLAEQSVAIRSIAELQSSDPDEWIRRFSAWAERPRPVSPNLSDAALSRESIYEGRL